MTPPTRPTTGAEATRTELTRLPLTCDVPASTAEPPVSWTAGEREAAGRPATRLAASLQPGEHLQLLMKEDAKTGSRPLRRIGVYHPIPVEDPDRCRHLHSICRICLPEWRADYFVRRFAHGSNTAYLTYGCRCDVCCDARSDGSDTSAARTDGRS